MSPVIRPEIVDRMGDYYVVLKPNGQLGIVPIIIAGAIALAAVGASVGVDAFMSHRAKVKAAKIEKASDEDFARMMREYDSEEAAIRSMIPPPAPSTPSWILPAAVSVGVLAVGWAAFGGDR